MVTNLLFNKRFFIESLGWGIFLWLIGYLLGIVLFFVLPAGLIGWIIAPIGILITLWVLLKKIQGQTFEHYILLAIIWTAVAIIFDYLFLVKALNTAEGYYKIDVFFYYFMTFFIPISVGWWKSKVKP